MPKALPLTVTSARFLTSPMSIQTCEPFFSQSAFTSTVFVYVPDPEKYLTSASLLSLQDASLSSVIVGGAPRPGWKLTFHGPCNGATWFSVLAGSVKEVPLVALWKTTNTVPQGSSVRGIVVRPSAILKDTGSDFPVSACHSSGAFPATRKVASSCSPRSLRLSTKYTTLRSAILESPSRQAASWGTMGRISSR